jgi:hypothetical protein
MPDSPELDDNDELGNIEAEDVPDAQAEDAPYVEDPNYDSSLAGLDPDKQGGDLPHSPEEWEEGQ